MAEERRGREKVQAAALGSRGGEEVATVAATSEERCRSDLRMEGAGQFDLAGATFMNSWTGAGAILKEASRHVPITRSFVRRGSAWVRLLAAPHPGGAGLCTKNPLEDLGEVTMVEQ